MIKGCKYPKTIHITHDDIFRYGEKTITDAVRRKWRPIAKTIKFAQNLSLASCHINYGSIPNNWIIQGAKSFSNVKTLYLPRSVVCAKQLQRYSTWLKYAIRLRNLHYFGDSDGLKMEMSPLVEESYKKLCQQIKNSKLKTFEIIENGTQEYLKMHAALETYKPPLGQFKLALRLISAERNTFSYVYQESGSKLEKSRRCSLLESFTYISWREKARKYCENQSFISNYQTNIKEIATYLLPDVLESIDLIESIKVVNDNFIASEIAEIIKEIHLWIFNSATQQNLITSVSNYIYILFEKIGRVYRYMKSLELEEILEIFLLSKINEIDSGYLFEQRELMELGNFGRLDGSKFVDPIIKRFKKILSCGKFIFHNKEDLENLLNKEIEQISRLFDSELENENELGELSCSIKKIKEVISQSEFAYFPESQLQNLKQIILSSLKMQIEQTILLKSLECCSFEDIFELKIKLNQLHPQNIRYFSAMISRFQNLELFYLDITNLLISDMHKFATKLIELPNLLKAEVLIKYTTKYSQHNSLERNNLDSIFSDLSTSSKLKHSFKFDLENLCFSLYLS